MGDDCARIYSAENVAQFISLKRGVFNRARVGTVFALLLSETDFNTGNNIKSFIEDTMVCDMPQRGGFPSGARLSSCLGKLIQVTAYRLAGACPLV